MVSTITYQDSFSELLQPAEKSWEKKLQLKKTDARPGEAKNRFSLQHLHTKNRTAVPPPPPPHHPCPPRPPTPPVVFDL